MAGPGMGSNPANAGGPQYILQKYAQDPRSLTPDELKQLKFMPASQVAAAQSAPAAYNPAAEMQGLAEAQPDPAAKENIIKRGVDWLNNVGKVDLLGAAKAEGNRLNKAMGTLDTMVPQHTRDTAWWKAYEAQKGIAPPAAVPPDAISAASQPAPTQPAAPPPVAPSTAAEVPEASSVVPTIPSNKALSAPEAAAPANIDPQKVAAFTSFLKSNPNPATLGNVLDVLGSALLSHGGTYVPTRLQQKYNMQLQSQQASNIAQAELQKQLALLPAQAQKEIQVATAQGDINKAMQIAVAAGINPYAIKLAYASRLFGLGGEGTLGANVNPEQLGMQYGAGQ